MNRSQLEIKILNQLAGETSPVVSQIIDGVARAIEENNKEIERNLKSAGITI